MEPVRLPKEKKLSTVNNAIKLQDYAINALELESNLERISLASVNKKEVKKRRKRSQNRNEMRL